MKCLRVNKQTPNFDSIGVIYLCNSFLVRSSNNYYERISITCLIPLSQCELESNFRGCSWVGLAAPDCEILNLRNGPHMI